MDRLVDRIVATQTVFVQVVLHSEHATTQTPGIEHRRVVQSMTMIGQNMKRSTTRSRKWVSFRCS